MLIIITKIIKYSVVTLKFKTVDLSSLSLLMDESNDIGEKKKPNTIKRPIYDFIA